MKQTKINSHIIIITYFITLFNILILAFNRIKVNNLILSIQKKKK